VYAAKYLGLTTANTRNQFQIAGAAMLQPGEVKVMRTHGTNKNI